MKLYHRINGGWQASDEAINSVLEGGLQVAKSDKWADIKEIIPQRPSGIYFWGAETKEEIGHPFSDRIIVKVEDLDTDCLFAWPAEASQTANYKAIGYELTDQGEELLATAKAIPFSEFTGQFWPEWIYTKDVPAEIIFREE